MVPKRGCDVLGKGYNNTPGVYDGSDFYQVGWYPAVTPGAVNSGIHSTADS
jgi:hypothetical protein